MLSELAVGHSYITNFGERPFEKSAVSGEFRYFGSESSRARAGLASRSRASVDKSRMTRSIEDFPGTG